METATQCVVDDIKALDASMSEVCSTLDVRPPVDPEPQVPEDWPKVVKKLSRRVTQLKKENAMLSTELSKRVDKLTTLLNTARVKLEAHDYLASALVNLALPADSRKKVDQLLREYSNKLDR